MKFKFYFLFFIFCLAAPVNSIAETGCNLGNDIYPTLTSEIYRDCTTCVDIPVYAFAGGIHLVNTNEQACGVARNSVNTSNNLGRCMVRRNSTTLSSGNLNTYTASLNTCPIDDYIPFLILAFGALGFYNINKRKTNIFPVN